MGNIGDNPREIEFEPIETPAPLTVPAEPDLVPA